VARWDAEVARQVVDLEDTVIRAPTAGVVLEKLKEVGEIAVPGGFAGSGELVRMANLDDLRAELDVNEGDLSRIRLGQKARVVPDAYPDRAYAASVVKLYPQINRPAAAEGAGAPTLAEGTGAQAETAAVLAPRAGVRREDGRDFAWVVSEGRLRRQPLEVAGPSGADQVLVASGLAGGEALVVGEAEGLREGQAVAVEP
jgi:hypothetical protein